MPAWFVNLPVRYVTSEPQYAESFLALGVHPEWGLDAVAMQDFSRQWHTAVAERFRARGLACSMHLPFLDLAPASLDDYALEATRRRLTEAMALARIYRPRLLVAHAAHDSEGHRPFMDRWLERSLATWTLAHEAWPEHPPLHLENTFETDPEPLAELVAELRPLNMGLCFDAGHWNSFARGHARRDLGRWLDVLAPCLTHVHLHDNDGTADQHLGMGQGTIPWDEFFAGLAQRGLRPTATLEPHTPQAFEASKAFLQAHPHWAALLAETEE